MGIQFHPLSLSRLHHLLRRIQADMAYILYSSSKYIQGWAVLVAGILSVADAGFEASRLRGAEGCPKLPGTGDADVIVNFLSAGLTQPVNNCVAGSEKRLTEAPQAGSAARQVYGWSVSAALAGALVLNRYEVSGC